MQDYLQNFQHIGLDEFAAYLALFFHAIPLVVEQNTACDVFSIVFLWGF